MWVCKQRCLLLTTLRQHALLHLFQLLCAVSQLHRGGELALSCPQTLPAGHAAVAPVRPRGQHAGDCIYTKQSCSTTSRINVHEKYFHCN